MTQKILSFCLRHWKEIALVALLLVVFGKSRYDMNSILEAHKASEDSLRSQLEQLQGIHADELRARDEALEDYKSRNEELEHRYDNALRDLSTKVTKDKKRVIRYYREDKQSLIEEIETTYGFTYVP